LAKDCYNTHIDNKGADMKESNFLLGVGFLLAFGGVGGIENSMTDADLAGATLIAVTGCLIMWCGTLMMRTGK
jgi:hypothetical protein